MYVGKKITKTHAHDDLLPFTCASCGWQGVALVTGVGEGAGNSPFFLDNEGAAQRAAAQAQDEARDNATDTLKLARCPECGQRDPGAARAFWGALLAKAGGGVLFIWAVGGFIYALDGADAALWIFGVLGPVAGALILWTQAWKWTTADARVQFGDG